MFEVRAGRPLTLKKDQGISVEPQPARTLTDGRVVFDLFESSAARPFYLIGPKVGFQGLADKLAAAGIVPAGYVKQTPPPTTVTSITIKLSVDGKQALPDQLPSGINGIKWAACADAAGADPKFFDQDTVKAFVSPLSTHLYVDAIALKDGTPIGNWFSASQPRLKLAGSTTPTPQPTPSTKLELGLATTSEYLKQ